MGNNLININQSYITNEKEYSDMLYGEISLDNKKSVSDTRIKMLNNLNIDIEKKIDDKKRFRSKDIGFNSPSSESYFKISEDGEIDIYANGDCRVGFRPSLNTINLFAQNFNVDVKNININCDRMGLNINGFVLNPFIYEACATGYDKNSYRDLIFTGTARTWNDGLLNPDWTRTDVGFKPFFPMIQDKIEAEIDQKNGW